MMHYSIVRQKAFLKEMIFVKATIPLSHAFHSLVFIIPYATHIETVEMKSEESA